MRGGDPAGSLSNSSGMLWLMWKVRFRPSCTALFLERIDPTV